MQKFLLLFFFVSIINGWFSLNTQMDLVRIQTPVEGEYLQGNVHVEGTITGSGFQNAEISFRYQDSQSTNWFIIEIIEEEVVDDTIAIWDTSTIADGVYQIRVVVFFEDGREQEVIINTLNVSNYTPFNPVETEKPQILQTDETPAGLIIQSTPTTIVLPTPMPPNELIITRSQFILTMVQGAVLGILFLFVIVLFIIIRRRKMG